MSIYRRYDDKTSAAPWRAAYRPPPSNDAFDELIERLRQQDRVQTSNDKGRAA